MFVHGLNVVISDVGAHHKSANACVFYFLNVLIDTTLGDHFFLPFHHLASYPPFRRCHHLSHPPYGDVYPYQ